MSGTTSQYGERRERLIDTLAYCVGFNTAILSQTGGYQGVGVAMPSTIVLPNIR